MSALQMVDVALHRGSWRGRFSFSVERGEWLSIVGPSGSGKSSLLEAIAGFLKPDAGFIRVEGLDVSGLAPARRGVGYVFQANALFSHLTLERNLLLALHDVKMSRASKLAEVREMCASLKLSARFLGRFPHEVSGGELARFNLARTLLRPARVLLLDEPFSALDESLRFEMNALVRSLHESRGLTTICVTHHQEDAFLFADKVMVVREGEVGAHLPPRELSLNPPSPEVADFLRTGTLFEREGKVYFLRPRDLALTPDAASRFVHPMRIHIERFRWSSAGTHDTILDLDTGRIFRLPPAVDFQGEIFFDAAVVPCFSGASAPG